MKFIVSAPGKVILFGEHAVVYGYPAISAAIGLRCHFEVTTDSSDLESDFISFNFQDLGPESIRLPKSLCLTDTSHLNSNLVDYSWSITATSLGQPQDSLSKQTPLNRSSCVLVYLILRMITLQTDWPSPKSPLILDPQTCIQINIASDIPKSAGLGSSAAFAVGASTVLLVLFGHLPLVPDWIPSPKQLDVIQQLAQEAESIIHGKSSGLDTSSSAQGGLLVYQNLGKPCTNQLTPPGTKNMASQIRILLVNSHLTRSTQTIVQQLSHAYQTNPDVGAIFKQIGTLVDTAIRLLTQPGLGWSWDLAKQLSTLVSRNQELLTQLRVSCPELDDLVSSLKKHGISAKLTGAGCGGFVIGFPLPPDNPEQWTQVLDYLRQEKQLWAQLVGISDQGVRIKLCQLCDTMK